MSASLKEQPHAEGWFGQRTHLLQDCASWLQETCDDSRHYHRTGTPQLAEQNTINQSDNQSINIT